GIRSEFCLLYGITDVVNSSKVSFDSVDGFSIFDGCESLFTLKLKLTDLADFILGSDFFKLDERLIVDEFVRDSEVKEFVDDEHKDTCSIGRFVELKFVNDFDSTCFIETGV
ncbi:unnamed protein product, partial [Adineta steineri]